MANDDPSTLDDYNSTNETGSSNGVAYKYQTEITQMLFVFGDVVDPDSSVVQLVEDIVRTQVVEMVIQSKRLAARRSSKSLSPEDLLFLIRYDRSKTNRLRTYLSWKDVRKKAKDQEPGSGVGNDDLEVEDMADNNPSRLAPKQVKLPWELSSLYSEHLQPASHSGEGGNMDDLDEPDEDDIEAHEDSLARLREADEATKGMSQKEYVHYSECRQASFTFKKAKKFREWIHSSNYLEVKPNDDIIDVLGFLAFEVVRELCIGAVKLKKLEEEVLSRKTQDQILDPEIEEDGEDDEEEGIDEDDTLRPSGIENNGKEKGDEKIEKEKGDGNGEVEGETSGLIGNESIETTKGSSKRKSSPIKRKNSKSEEPNPNSTSRNSSPSPIKKKKRKDEPINSKGPFCSLFLPPETHDRPLLPSHIHRTFADLQKSKVFLQSSSTALASGGGLRRTKVFVM